MLTKNDNQQPVHYPAKPNKFEFDKEVSKIFDDMAVRSIPMYQESRRLLVSIMDDHRRRTGNNTHAKVLDFGASTGAFIKETHLHQDVWYKLPLPNYTFTAVDISESMCHRMRESLPMTEVLQGGLEILRHFRASGRTFDFINALYVIQFLERNEQEQAIELMYDLLTPGGMLFYGGKEQESGVTQDTFRSLYIHFRKTNGYTDEEIKAKTKALANSMWPPSQEGLDKMLYSAGFLRPKEVCRWLQFRTLVASK